MRISRTCQTSPPQLCRPCHSTWEYPEKRPIVYIKIRVHESFNLLSSSQTQHQMQGGLFLDVVITQGSSVFQLFACKNKTLLIRWDSFLILNLSFDIVNRITGLNLKGDGLASQGLDKDLHTSTKSQDKMECGFLLDVVVAQGTTIFQLLASEDKTLLVWWDSFLVLDLGLDIVNGVTGLNLKSD